MGKHRTRLFAWLLAVPALAGLPGCSDDPAPDSGAAPAEEDQPAAAAADPCAPWTVETLATGLGAVENLLVEADGGVLLSVADAGEVRRRSTDGEVVTVVDGLAQPGGLARGPDGAYVTTGLTIDAALQGTPTGTIVRFDPATGSSETWATGLVAPNGLALLPDGSAVTTRTLSGAGQASEVTRVPAPAPGATAADPAATEPLWSDLTGTNGAALDPGGEWLWVTRIAERAEVWRIPVGDPSDRELIADLGPGTDEIPDDLTVAPDGAVYVATFASGQVHRIDAETGEACIIADELPQATAVELTDTDAPDGAPLLVSSMTGTLYRLSPPV